MRRNYAIIDLGTNTFNLLIVSKNGSEPEVLFKTREPVKLGQGGMTTGKIAPDAFKRGTDTLRRYNQIIEEHNCDKVYAFATSAIRSAANGDDFVEAVRKKLGIHIEVIAGDREAELIWKGIKSAVELKETTLLMDIGGGSTEFIIADQDKVLWSRSFKLGVSRLFEQFSPSDPMKTEEVQQAETFLQEELSPLFEAIERHPVSCLVGSSGSFNTFAKMIAHHKGEMETVDDRVSYPFGMEEYLNIHQDLLASTKEERLNTPGIEPFRADFIVLGSILTKLVIDKCAISELTYSAYNMKEGILAEV